MVVYARLRVPVLRRARACGCASCRCGSRSATSRSARATRARGAAACAAEAAGAAGRVLGDARRAVRRPGPARGSAPVGARRAARARRRALRRRPPLRAGRRSASRPTSARGVRAGVATTPTLFVDGERHAGRPDRCRSCERAWRTREYAAASRVYRRSMATRRPAHRAPAHRRDRRGAARALPHLLRRAVRLRAQRARRARGGRGARPGGLHARLAPRRALRPRARQRAHLALPDRPPRDHRRPPPRRRAARARRCTSPARGRSRWGRAIEQAMLGWQVATALERLSARAPPDDPARARSRA